MDVRYILTVDVHRYIIHIVSQTLVSIGVPAGRVWYMIMGYVQHNIEDSICY